MVSIAPARHDLQALLVRRQGDLRDQPYRLLLLAIAALGTSGTLTLRRGPLEKEIVFHAGAAVDCHSNIATETLGRFLVSNGRISEAQYRDALPISAARGLAVEDVVLERRLVSPEELHRARQQSLGRKLLEPFSWTCGTWHLSNDTPLDETAHRVRVPQLIVTGIGKVEPFETIEAALHGAGAEPMSAGRSPLFDPSELRLTADQQKLLSDIRGGASLDGLRSSTNGHEDLERFVYALLLLGVVERATAAEVPAPAPAPIPEPAALAVPFFELDLAPEEPAAAPPTAMSSEEREAVAVAPQAPAIGTLTVPSASPEEVSAACLASRSQSAFELLGLESAAGAVEITRAFVRLAERFLPARYDEMDGLRDKAQEVFLAIARAYAELADPSRRQALIDRQASRRDPEATAPAPPPRPVAAPVPARSAASPPRRTIIDPEELHKQGRAAAAAGRLRDALGYFEMASECDAQNGTYAAEVAYCRFQLMISPAATTVKLLKNAIRIDPRCGVAYLYLGKIQEALGNHLEAQAYLGRASTLMRSQF